MNLWSQMFSAAASLCGSMYKSVVSCYRPGCGSDVSLYRGFGFGMIKADMENKVDLLLKTTADLVVISSFMLNGCLSSEICRKQKSHFHQLLALMKIVMKRARRYRAPPAHGLPGMSSAAAWFPIMLALQMMQPRVPSKVRRTRVVVKPICPPVRAGQDAEISAPHEFASEAPTTEPVSSPLSQGPGSASLDSRNVGPGDYVATALSGQVSAAAVQLPPSDSGDALSQRFAKACSCQLHDFLQWSTLPRSEIHSY